MLQQNNSRQRCGFIFVTKQNVYRCTSKWENANLKYNEEVILHGLKVGHTKLTYGFLLA